MSTSTNMAFQHEPGTAIECLSVRKPCCFRIFHNLLVLFHAVGRLHLRSYFQIPITLKKEQAGVDINGEKILKCGFKIGGGIDQNYMKSPQGYSDNVIFVF